MLKTVEKPKASQRVGGVGQKRCMAVVGVCQRECMGGRYRLARVTECSRDAMQVNWYGSGNLVGQSAQSAQRVARGAMWVGEGAWGAV